MISTECIQSIVSLPEDQTVAGMTTEAQMAYNLKSLFQKLVCLIKQYLVYWRKLSFDI